MSKTVFFIHQHKRNTINKYVRPRSYLKILLNPAKQSNSNAKNRYDFARGQHNIPKGTTLYT